MAATLEITPIGTGAGYTRPGESQSCWLVRAAGRAVCVDLGSGALSALQGHIAPETLDRLVITHLHPDHTVDLLALRVYMAWGPGRGRTLPVLGPPGLRARLEAFGTGGTDEAFAFEQFAPGGGVRDLGDGLVLRHREVPHLPPTNAVRFDRDGRAVCFGADCGPNDALVELAADVDVLVCECSFGADPVPEGVPHLDARSAARIARRAGARRLVLTHGYPEHDRDAAVAVAEREFGGAVTWAQAGVTVTA